MDFDFVFFRDLSNAMSALNLAQNNSMQDQKQREALRSQFSSKSKVNELLKAPIPTRGPAASLPVAAAAGAAAATPGMWNPDAGIKFGGSGAAVNANVHNPAYPNTRTAQVQGGQWDPSRGVQFR